MKNACQEENVLFDLLQTSIPLDKGKLFEYYK